MHRLHVLLGAVPQSTRHLSGDGVAATGALIGHLVAVENALEVAVGVRLAQRGSSVSYGRTPRSEGEHYPRAFALQLSCHCRCGR
jgi:hypothetical protein